MLNDDIIWVIETSFTKCYNTLQWKILHNLENKEIWNHFRMLYGCSKNGWEITLEIKDFNL